MNLTLDFSNSNVNIYASNPSVNIILKDSGSIVDVLNANLIFQNNKFSFSNPASVNSFMLMNDGFFDEISYNVNGVKYSQVIGSNNVVGEVKYDNSVVTGASWSYYKQNGSGCGGNCQQQ